MRIFNKQHKIKKFDVLLLCFLVIIALIPRLYNIDVPLADWHSWRQSDTASVARNFTRDGLNLLRPTYDDLSNIQSGKYNPHGYRFVEFPLYNALIALPAQYFPSLNIVIIGRAISVIFSLLALICVYLLTLKSHNRKAAFFAGLVWSILPFIIYYSRVVLPDMTALSLSLISLTTLYGGLSYKRKALKYFLLLVSLLTVSCALMVKPTTLFFLIPAVYILYLRYKFSFVTKPFTYLYILFALLPLALWRYWISQFPEGIPFSQWLITSVNTPEGLVPIFFRPAFFRWIFFERISLMIGGGYLTALMVVGAVIRQKNNFLPHSIGIASLLYLLIFQGGNIQHDYYQIMIFPAIAMFSGIGASFLLSEKRIIINRILSLVFLIVILGFSVAFSFTRIKFFWEIAVDKVVISRIIATLTPVESSIITDTQGDTTLLYLSDRKGFPAPTDTFESLKERGAEYFVTQNLDYLDTTNFPGLDKLIFNNENVLIYSLKNL